MGKIDKILSKTILPERDDHNCRVFVDVAENVHFHYREHRIVFSVDEFRGFAKAITDGAIKLEELVKNGYKESLDNPAPMIIAGGSQTKSLLIKDSKKSAYFDDRFQIELQSEGYGDVFHIHFRDYRLVLRKYETWKKICEAFSEAWKNTKKEWFKE